MPLLPFGAAPRRGSGRAHRVRSVRPDITTVQTVSAGARPDLPPSSGIPTLPRLVVSRNHRRMLLVGLTGNIGSGKSAVAQLLSEHGATIIDADVLARRAVDVGTQAYRSIA